MKFQSPRDYNTFFFPLHLLSLVGKAIGQSFNKEFSVKFLCLSQGVWAKRRQRKYRAGALWHRMTECSELEGAHKDHKVHLFTEWGSDPQPWCYISIAGLCSRSLTLTPNLCSWGCWSFLIAGRLTLVTTWTNFEFNKKPKRISCGKGTTSVLSGKAVLCHKLLLMVERTALEMSSFSWFKY